MILKRENKEGFIYAYFLWDIVNKHGVPMEWGNYMYVRDIWVHPTFKGDDVIKDFIRELDDMRCNRDILWIYWKRGKRNDKLSKPFRRATALRRIRCLFSKI